MSRTIVRVTQQGFTHCPACSNYIKVAEDVVDTECAFCGEALRVTASQAKGMALGSQIVAVGRGALVAGALVGLTAFAGCGDDDEYTDGGSNSSAVDEDAGDEDAGDDASDDAASDVEVEDVFNPNNQGMDYGGGEFTNNNSAPTNNNTADAGGDVEPDTP